VLASTAHFDGLEVVVTEKMDGENCTIGRTYTHARSLDSAHHPSRAWVKGLQGRIGPEIPEGWRLCGENLFARHSIVYGALPSYFLLFSVWDDRNECLSWSETEVWAVLLGLETVPVLYQGPWDEAIVRTCWTGRSTASTGDEQEGYVVRAAKAFQHAAFDRNIAKYVRPAHVQTDAHWMQQEVVPNRLRPVLDSMPP
jgi:hypothetical protein